MNDSADNNSPNTIPFLNPQKTLHQGTEFAAFEVALANRNSGTLLETLRHDLTPVGAHYLLNHFDVPYVTDSSDWALTIAGAVSNPVTLKLDDIKSLPRHTEPVTLECAGNGRALMSPRWPSQPWAQEAVGTAEWTGTPLAPLLDQAGISSDAVEVVFYGTDEGISSGDRHHYGRSLTVDEACNTDVLLVYEMNGQPLLPQHGFPLRLIVPGWYGMASVKWLNNIDVIETPFDGHQQVKTYVLKDQQGNPTAPVKHMKVRALMIPPGIPDWTTRKRLVDPGVIEIHGRAWSGQGVPISKVEFFDNGNWLEAELHTSKGKYAWTAWSCNWDATPGRHELRCRATDANGDCQPLEAFWDYSGFCNNIAQSVEVWCP